MYIMYSNRELFKIYIAICRILADLAIHDYYKTLIYHAFQPLKIGLYKVC